MGGDKVGGDGCEVGFIRNSFYLHQGFTGKSQPVNVMNEKSERETVRLIAIPSLSREVVIKFLIVLGMAGMGIGLMIAGFMAWIVGENLLLFTGFFTGAIFISGGALGFLNCLDGREVE